MAAYYGDVEVVVKMRWRVAAEIKGRPTKAKMLTLLQDEAYEDDVTDEEVFEVLEVLEVGPNADGGG